DRWEDRGGRWRLDRSGLDPRRGNDGDGDAAAAGGAPRGPARAAHPPGGRVLSGARLLIVDDEASIRDMLAFFFHKRGFEVLTASNYPAGSASALRSSPDLILCDIKMPDSNRLHLLRQTKAQYPPP